MTRTDCGTDQRQRRLPTGGRLLALLSAMLFALSWTAVAGAQDAAIDNRRCYNCHGQPHLGELPAEQRRGMLAHSDDVDWLAAPAQRPELYVTPDDHRQSLHSAINCVDCHRDARQLPHAARLEPAECTSACHPSAVSGYTTSAHGQASRADHPEASRCATCHGAHDMRPASDRASRLHPLQVLNLCADCHRQHDQPVATDANGEAAMDHYLASVHGRALSDSGLVVAATCVSCHGAHDVRPANDPLSLVNRAQVPQTCGQCHLGVVETYARSIHGQRLADGHETAPVCTDCHTAHGITRAATPRFLRDIVGECGDCHDQSAKGRSSLYQSYRRSYHGQVTILGSTRAARCSDCHGTHDILPVDDPLARIHMDNRQEMCASCHPDANANFILYEPHADHRDRARYPILYAVWWYFIIVMSATFSFFGLHSLLWFVRSGVHRIRHGAHPRPKSPAHGIKRFSRVDRVNHALVIITFFGLTLTGMPLFFADQKWAAVLAAMFGGVHTAGLLHRFFAILLLGNFVVHLVGVVRRVIHYGPRRILLGPESMVPRWKDVQDCLGMFRWFFGGARKPRFDRWTYWEKFDYWAEIFGTLVIGGTGLLMWFPSFFAQWLPGWIFNAAIIVHGYEALLAVGFIFTIHFFNAHLRWEKFPVDDVMFTGQLPEEEFLHERPLEYERLKRNNELQTVRVAPAPSWQRPLAVSIGILAMVIGTAMVALIVLGGLGMI